MSITPIQRADSTFRAVQPLAPQPGGSAGPNPFDAGQAAIKAAAEPKPAEAKGLHSQVLAEALDGDASEAIMRGSAGVGKRDGLVDDDAGPQIAEEQRVQKKARARSVQGNDDAAKGAEQSGKRSSAQRTMRSTAGSVGAVGKTNAAELSLSGQHDELMMLSATMSRRDLATFLARKHAAKLSNIFSGEAWQVKRDASQRLNAAQMPK